MTAEVDRFLAALTRELVTAPSEPAANRQVMAAAATAREEWVRYRKARRTFRRMATLAAAIMLLGTGGLATAGSLPSPMQRVVAQAATTFRLTIPHPDRLREDALLQANTNDRAEVVLEEEAPPTPPARSRPPASPGEQAGGKIWEREGKGYWKDLQRTYTYDKGRDEYAAEEETPAVDTAAGGGREHGDAGDRPGWRHPDGDHRSAGNRGDDHPAIARHWSYGFADEGR